MTLHVKSIESTSVLVKKQLQKSQKLDLYKRTKKTFKYLNFSINFGKTLVKIRFYQQEN